MNNKRVPLNNPKILSSEESIDIAVLEQHIAELKKDGFSKISLHVQAGSQIIPYSTIGTDPEPSPCISEIYLKGSKN